MDLKNSAFTFIMNQEEERFLELTQNPQFDISWTDNNGNNLLTQAIRYTTTKIFDKLIELNIDVNTPNGYGNTPLIWSIKEKGFDMFAKILEQNPDISFENVEKETAITYLLEYPKNTIKQFICAVENKTALASLESNILHTNHPLRDYSIKIIGVLMLEENLRNSLSNIKSRDKKRKL